jgi:blue light- and temperature-responsive anti-repressor
MPGTMRKAATPGSLYRLIYRSRAVIAEAVPEAVTEAGLQRELRAIVSTARWRNKDDNLTGALLFTGGGFAQVLEGRREIVERTFERIAADRRHTDVTVLSFTPTPQRSFPDWPMGFCGQPPPGSTELFEHLPDTSVFYGARVTTGSDVLRFLEKLVQREDVWIGA